MSAEVLVHDEGELRHIILNRPAKANALSIDMVRAIERAFRTPAAGTRAFVVSGEGGKGFCAGGDIGELRSGRRSEQYQALCDLIAAIFRRDLPLITVVHGNTLGAACIFSALSDIVLAAEETVIGIPEMHFGMYPALVHLLLLERLPSPLVYQLCIGARSLTAAEALALGLVTEIIPSAGFSAGVKARLVFYTQRIDALNTGRALRHLEHDGELIERARRAETLVVANLESGKVQELLGEWLTIARKQETPQSPLLIGVVGVMLLLGIIAPAC